jgi:hypothetical protein
MGNVDNVQAGAFSMQIHVEQQLSLCLNFIVQGTHENKLTPKLWSPPVGEPSVQYHAST